MLDNKLRRKFNMSDSFYRAIADKAYLEATGEAARRRQADEEQRRRADAHQRAAMGDDCPPPKQGGRC